MPERFASAQRVSLLNNPAKRGEINNLIGLSGGYYYYDVQWDDGSLGTVGEHELAPEILNPTAWDLLASNQLYDYRNFSIASTVHKVKNTAANTISSLKASRTIFKPYQFKPLVKFLNSDNKRILVADEVGLGKTIEAGHIMLEMAARGQLKNALIICTKSLKDKWQLELQEKFNLFFKVYDRAADFIQDIEADVSASKRSVLGILNYEQCRNKKLLQKLEESNYRFDLLVCDEAHKLRNNETAQHRGVSKIIDAAEAVVFLTATPIMTELRNLFNLVRLLDKNRYGEFDIFNNAVNLNKPFIIALNTLRDRQINMKTIAAALDSSKVVFESSINNEVYKRTEHTVGELFAGDALYQRVRSRMLNWSGSDEQRVEIQQDLMELNSLNHLYTRTRKRDVLGKDEAVIRDPKTILVTLSDEEREVYDSVLNEYADGNGLALMQRKRQMSSSIIAFQSDRHELEEGNYDSSLPDAKFEAFNTILEEVVNTNKKKIIVFSFFTNTLLYLKARLEEKGYGVEIIYGDIKDRTERINKFKTNTRIQVLLSSEVGSEGLDLQFCDALVNYDLPWNPMVVEQRIGRIDRVGQMSSIINIYNLIIEDTIEKRIYERLYERINVFRESIGDLEEILGETESLGELVTAGIENLYRTKMSEQQQLEELERIQLAIITNRNMLDNVRQQLAEAFANDFHFQNEIEAIEKNKRYLTKEEIITYLESIFRLELSYLNLKHVNEKVSVIEVPANARGSLFHFIDDYKDTPERNPELETMYRRFKRFRDERSIAITFDQEHAYQNRNVEFISAFHPLVNAITNYFEGKNYLKNTAHKLAVRKSDLDGKLCEGHYLLTVFTVRVKKNHGDGKVAAINYLKSVLVDLNTDETQVVQGDLSDFVYGVAQLKAEQFLTDIQCDAEIVRVIRPIVSMEMTRVKDSVADEEKLRFHSSLHRRIERELEYIEVRIQRSIENIRNGAIETVEKSKIVELENRKAILLNQQRQAHVEVEQELISVNLLEVL